MWRKAANIHFIDFVPPLPSISRGNSLIWAYTNLEIFGTTKIFGWFRCIWIPWAKLHCFPIEKICATHLICIIPIWRLFAQHALEIALCFRLCQTIAQMKHHFLLNFGRQIWWWGFKFYSRSTWPWKSEFTSHNEEFLS